MGLPVVAKYTAVDKQMAVYDIAAMMDYFKKGDLNPHTKTVTELWKGTAKSTAQAMLRYAEVMDISVYEQQGNIAAVTHLAGYC